MIEQATAAPITREINGKEYTFARIRLSIWGKVFQWKKDQIIQSAAKQASQAEDKETKNLILDRADEKAKWWNIENDEAFHAALIDMGALTRLIYESLKVHHSDMTIAEAEGVFDRLEDRTLMQSILAMGDSTDDNDGSKKN